MWGNIATEATFQVNFNVGFSNTRSDILIHLSQWQYWWWFWFVFLWSLYFMLIIRVVRFRTLKFQPRIVTSFRPHGKWGDLLVCLIPTMWCINILINSSFLLKLIEWQNETSLFTIRIRGKQWYWIYKFDVKDVADILSIGKNVGNNKFYYPTPNGLNNLDDYLHLIQLRASNVWLKKYWNVSLRLQPKEDREYLVASADQIPNIPVYTKKFIIKDRIYDLYNTLLNFRKKPHIFITNGVDKFSMLSSHGENFKWYNTYTDRWYFDQHKKGIIANYGFHFDFDPDWTGSPARHRLKIISRFYDSTYPEYSFSYRNENDYVTTMKYSNFEKSYYEIMFTYKAKISRFVFRFYYNEHILNTFFNKFLDVKKCPQTVGSLRLSSFFDNKKADALLELKEGLLENTPGYSKFYKVYNVHRMFRAKRWKFFSINPITTPSEYSQMNFDLLKKDRDYFLYNNKLHRKPFINSMKNNVSRNLNFDNFTVPLKKNINFDESLRWLKRGFGKTEPLKIIKVPYNKGGGFLLKTRFTIDDAAIHKNVTYNPYLVIKQKRYTLKKKILEKNFKIHNKEYKGKSGIAVKSNFFIKNNVGGETYNNLSKVYKLFKKNKKRDEMFSVVTSRRLLRTKHTLVLPAHVNITAITNSYDVVHSWFIPGLGLKLDCIPGRATHHTFYADNVGFYYGQCAEICGRYHHHMPIRLCILPYDQFLVWWHHFGLPRLMYSCKNRTYVNNFYFRKYVW